MHHLVSFNLVFVYFNNHGAPVLMMSYKLNYSRSQMGLGLMQASAVLNHCAYLLSHAVVCINSGTF